MEVNQQALFQATPSPTPPFVLSLAWLSSEIFVKAARADIQALLTVFSQQWSELLESYKAIAVDSSVEGPVEGSIAKTGPQTVHRLAPSRPMPRKAVFRKARGVNKSGPSLFATFKHCWVNLGWDKVHLSIVDPCVRTEWFRTVSRLFLERLTPGQPIGVERAGALLGIYTFWASQPSAITQQHITVDLSTLDGIDAAPIQLASAVDFASPTGDEQALRASDDLLMAVQLMHHAPFGTAFLLVPTVAFCHPSLPSNRLVLAKRSPSTVDAFPTKRARLTGRPKDGPNAAAQDVRALQRSAPASPQPYVPMGTPEALEWLQRPAEEDAHNGPNGSSASPMPPVADSMPHGTIEMDVTMVAGQSEWTTSASSSSKLTQEEVNELLLRGLHSPAATQRSHMHKPSDSRLTVAAKAHDSSILGVGSLPTAARPSTTSHDSANDYLDFLRPDES